jgi:hypothetical protein
MEERLHRLAPPAGSWEQGNVTILPSFSPAGG